jgi:hypothetical protein
MNEHTLRLSGNSHSTQVVCRGVGEKFCMFESVDSEWSVSAPVAFFPGLKEGDMLVLHTGWTKAEIVQIIPESSIIMPPKPKLVT